MKKFNIPNLIDSWTLAKKSFFFLIGNKDLNIFPFLSVMLIIALGTGVYFIFPREELMLNNVYGFISLCFLAYFIFSFVITYLDTALTAVVLKRLNHQSASVLEGFQSANQHLYAILKWSLFTSTIGKMLKIFESLQNVAKKMFGYSIGFSWSIAAYFVLPLVITEKMSPFKAMQRSLDAVGRGYKNTVSVRFLITIAFIFIFFIISEFITSYPIETTNLMISLLPLFLITYFVAETLETILVSALFLNIVRLSPKNFDPSLLARAFKKDE